MEDREEPNIKQLSCLMYMMSNSFFHTPDLKVLQHDPNDVFLESFLNFGNNIVHDSLPFDMVDQGPMIINFLLFDVLSLGNFFK